MYPVLFEIGPITVYSLWVFIAAGFFASLLIMNKLIQKYRLKLAFMAEHSLGIFLSGIIVSRLFYVIRFNSIYFHNFSQSSLFKIFYIWDKGLSGWGGIVGILLSLIYFAHKKNEDVQKWLDVMTVSVIGAITFANIGAFFDGRNYGNETDLPWGIIMQTSMYAVPIHPTQIYAAIYSAIITIILYKLSKEKIAITSGNISIFGLTAYSFCKFIEEFFRGDEAVIILGLREMQIYALLGLIAGLTLIYLRFFEKTLNLTKKIKKFIK